MGISLLVHLVTINIMMHYAIVNCFFGCCHICLIIMVMYESVRDTFPHLCLFNIKIDICSKIYSLSCACM